MIWKEVKGYKGYYEISNIGTVRSVDRTIVDTKGNRRKLKGKPMKLVATLDRRSNSTGYMVVNLRRNGVSNVVPVHRLVAEAFLDNPNNLPTVNHKDGNKQNNCLENLEWASYSKNNIHAIQTNLRKPRGNKIQQISPNGEVVGEYESSCQASRMTGVSRGMINHCLNGRCKSAGGYVWIRSKECNDYPNRSTAEDELLSEEQERVKPEDIV